ncbi:uncharacterized protein [Dermacentor albipictus]|uniref:uncharacterized protein n=1 Tax=Dermacentor albipictus TaxID=60249 RepID=UPI0038FC0413
MRPKRGDRGVRKGQRGADLFRTSGSSMEELAASRSSRSSSEERLRSTPPHVDTARAWMAAAACSGYSFFTWLPVVCSSVLYAGYMDQYPEVARRDASWPFTIMLVVINVGGILYAVSLEWFTERSLLILAAVLCAGSLVVSSFTHDILQLVILLGVVYGMGVASTSIVPTVLMVHHFNKYRATALAIVSGSVDVSGMMTPSLVQLFIDKYGFSGCLLLLGGLSLNLFIACIFLKRPGKKADEDTGEATAGECMKGETIKTPGEVTSAAERLEPKEPACEHGYHSIGEGGAAIPMWQPSRGDVRAWLKNTVSLAMVHVRPLQNPHGDDDGRNIEEASANTMHTKTGMVNRVSSLKLKKKFNENAVSGIVEIACFKPDKEGVQLEKAPESLRIQESHELSPESDVGDQDRSKGTAAGTFGFVHKLRAVSTGYIWMVCLSKGASNFSSYTFGLVIVDYAHESGVLGQRAALLPALFSLGCLVATLTTGPAVDRSWVSKYSAMMLSCVVQTCGLIASSVWRSFPVLALGAFLGGAGRGIRCFLFPVLISDRCPLDDLPAALSIMNAACSATLFLRTPVIGFMRDSSGTYATLLMCLAGINVFQLVVWFIYASVTKCYSR